MDFPLSGGALGGFSNITDLPLLKGFPNINFLGLGCRLKSAIDLSHLIMGIPEDLLAMVYIHIRDMVKSIAMLNNTCGGS